MSSEIAVGLIYTMGSGSTPITVRGAPQDPAIPALDAAIRIATGDWADGAVLTYMLGMPEEPGTLELDLVTVPADCTMEQLRLLVGSRDFAVTLRPGGIGGSGLLDFLVWAYEDLLPFGQNVLEVYGVAEIARRMGKAIRHRNHRELKILAKSWHSSLMWSPDEQVPSELLEHVNGLRAWSYEDAAERFGLDQTGVSALMHACGYRFSADDQRFHAPPDSEAVN